MPARLTIFHKGLILIGFPFLILVGFAWLVADAQGRQEEAQWWSSHTAEVIAQARHVLVLLVDDETGVRGFIITHDPVFTGPYDRARRELPGALESLQALVADNPDQQTKAGLIAKQAVVLFDWHAEAVRQVRGGRPEEAVAAAKSGQGKRQMDDLRREVAEFIAVEERLAQERLGAVRSLQHRLRGLILAGTAVSFLGVLALAFFFYLGISGRIGRLLENTRRLAAGNELIPATGGTDEITQLDAAFHGMARGLKESRAALEEKTTLLQSVLNSMGEGVIVADENARFLVFNPAAESILGNGATDAPPGEWSERYGVFLPDQVTPYPAQDLPLARALRDETVDAAELFIRHPRSPEDVWVSVTARPLRDERGRKRGGVVVFSDVTRRKQAEDQLRDLNQELEQRVLERTAELAEANRELTQKNQENEMFVYSVSHDLRSPLVNLQGFSKELDKGCQALTALLSDEALPPVTRTQGLALLSGKMAKSLSFIQTAVLRLSSIIDALLRLSRAGRVEYRLERVDVAGLVKQVLGAAEGTIQERGATVTAGELPPAWGDRAAIEQVFANLVGNALTYLDPARPGVIEMGCLDPAPPNTPEGFRVYYVKDNGLGVAEGHRQKIFQVFQRAHPGVGKGEGMGLAIVTRVVERHRGRVWLESTVGEGSTFFFSLPAEPRE